MTSSPASPSTWESRVSPERLPAFCWLLYPKTCPIAFQAGHRLRLPERALGKQPAIVIPTCPSPSWRKHPIRYEPVLNPDSSERRRATPMHAVGIRTAKACVCRFREMYSDIAHEVSNCSSALRSPATIFDEGLVASARAILPMFACVASDFSTGDGKMKSGEYLQSLSRRRAR